MSNTRVPVYVSSEQLSVIKRIAESDFSFIREESREAVELSLLCMGIMAGGANVQLVTLPKVENIDVCSMNDSNVIPFTGCSIRFEGIPS